jgi:hypothetical protein
MGSFGSGDCIPHTPADYDSREDWLRHCHEGGELCFDPEKEFRGISGSGYYAALAGATYGHTRREFQHAFEDYGTSTRIRPSQFKRNFRAVALANAIYGKVLNTTIDINLSTIGITQELTIARLHNEFLDWLRRWLARKGVPTLYVWSLEISKGGALHAHILVHVPPELAINYMTALTGTTPFRVHAEAALEAIVGKPLLRKPKSCTCRIRHRSTERTSNQWFAFQYRMKGLAGCKTEALNRFGMHRVSGQGRILTKRTGVSRLLDQKIYREIAALNKLPSFDLGSPGDRPYDDRYIKWHREFADELILPTTTLNGNRKGRGFIFGKASGVEPLDLDDAVKNARVSYPPTQETD